jgi:hypothetical protein
LNGSLTHSTFVTEECVSHTAAIGRVAIVEVKFKEVIKYGSILNDTDLINFFIWQAIVRGQSVSTEGPFLFSPANIIDYIFLENFFEPNF